MTAHRQSRGPNLSRACEESLHNMPMMKHLAAVMALLSVVVAGSAAIAQTKGFVPGKTPDGQPDLRGMWVNFDSTPFEAPAGAGVRPAAPIPNAPGINPPSHWADHDSPMKAPRASMVVDPPEGRVPELK